MKSENYIKIEFPSRSVNEGFARAAAAAFADGRHAGPPVIGRILWRGMCTPVFLCAG